MSPEELAAVIGEYDGLAIRSATKVTSDIIAAADKLKVVGRAGIGVDNVDIEAATRRGIVVMNTPKGNTITTAEHTISMMLALSRNIPQATQSMKEGKWEKKKLRGREVKGKTLGIVGMGNIGSILAELGAGVKMKVIGFDPFLDAEQIKARGAEPVSFDDLVAQADYISIHVPKTKETAGLFGAETLSKMKEGSYLINCARGGIVDEEALCEALESGPVAAAALDVFEVEPLPADSRLLYSDDVTCTPHLGASTYEAQDNVAIAVARQISKFLKTGEAENAVNDPK
jgi:D-3-phosphoglycerate dehydrogenase